MVPKCPDLAAEEERPVSAVKDMKRGNVLSSVGLSQGRSPWDVGGHTVRPWTGSLEAQGRVRPGGFACGSRGTVDIPGSVWAGAAEDSVTDTLRQVEGAGQGWEGLASGSESRQPQKPGF